MSNMSYCKFQNTLNDLKDCLESLEEGKIESQEEKVAAYEMMVKMTIFFMKIK